jgi:hypothetical protein
MANKEIPLSPYFSLLSGAFCFSFRPAPCPDSAYGTVVLIFSLLSFAESGSYITGGIFGIIGGLWVIFWKPKDGEGHHNHAGKTF